MMGMKSVTFHLVEMFFSSKGFGDDYMSLCHKLTLGMLLLLDVIVQLISESYATHLNRLQ